MSKMPDNIKKWIEELESGKHRQVQGTLKGEYGHGEVGYCCLGVYEEFVNGNTIPPVPEDEDGCFGEEGDTKIYSRLGIQIPEDLYFDGMSMNDNGESFQEIADMIKEYYANAN